MIDVAISGDGWNPSALHLDTIWDTRWIGRTSARWPPTCPYVRYSPATVGRIKVKFSNFQIFKF